MINNLEQPLSTDTQAILLLCGHFGNQMKSEIKPLTSSEYARFAQWLQLQNMRPADLLETASATKIKRFIDKTITPGRLMALLMRGGALALAVEAWTNKGLWIISRSDKAYPSRLKKQLGQTAPPIFYGVGQPTLLQKGGIAVVGSRDINKQMIDFTKIIAKKSAQQRMTVISGGARGVDTEAMLTALVHGGTVVGVLADSLTRAAIAGKYRDALREERLVLISSFDPDAGFNVGNAMARNKYVYALSDWSVVVNSGYQEGGTWMGATENLKAQWVPLFVRQDEPISVGNQHLINQGAIAIDKKTLQEITDLRQQLSQLSETLPVVKENDFVKTHHKDEIDVVDITEKDKEIKDLYDIAWPHIERQLVTEKTEKVLAEHFNLYPKQLRIWLTRALENGKIRKLKKPVRYIVNIESESEDQQTLFTLS
jgi:predicted Rossmann fold nucleotide-binding protein DprA/Smf involved in DNA uptake